MVEACIFPGGEISAGLLALLERMPMPKHATRSAICTILESFAAPAAE
jgi:hypothetical protein